MQRIVRKTVFKRADLEALLEAAKKSPRKEETKDELSVKELVRSAWPALHALMGKGYYYREVAKWLIDHGVAASEETLVTAIGEEARRRKKNRNGSTSQNGSMTRPITGGAQGGTVVQRREQSTTTNTVMQPTGKTDGQTAPAAPAKPAVKSAAHSNGSTTEKRPESGGATGPATHAAFEEEV